MRKVSIALIVLTALFVAGCTRAAAPPAPAAGQAEATPTTDCCPAGLASPESAATLDPLFPVSKDDSPWKIVRQVRVKQPTRMAAFLDESFGVTGGAGDQGKVHYTTDGGQTWTLAESSGG